MARRRRIKTVPDARRDFISELPADLKERILELLPTRDAARTALLSTHWKDIWLRHGQLVFDSDFFRSVQKCEDDKYDFNIIDNILLHRAGPVKKFTLDINGYSRDPSPKQTDIHRWCRFLSRNGVEELHLSFFAPDQVYKLPVCIFSCLTIKKLKLGGFNIDLPVNAGCIFPSITSLVFEDVSFRRSINGIASIPNLDRLSFDYGCCGIDKFQISAPKLEILSVTCHDYAFVASSEWFPLHLKTIKTLYLSGSLFSCKDVAAAVSMFPTAINLQVMTLYELRFSCLVHLTVALLLLQKSPNLCELGISAATESSWRGDKEAASRLLEDPDCCFINHMLNTVKIDSFSGSTPQMFFVKMLLSKSPALERVVIQVTYNMSDSMAVKILRDLVRFPRASPKAQIVYMDSRRSCGLVNYPRF